jgi:cobaltochelatase CobN
MGDLSETFTHKARQQAGEAWLAASAYAFDGDQVLHQPEAIAERVKNADSYVHLQDLAETDILLASDYATHEAGFAAAQSVTGGAAELYHLDNTRPNAPRARTLSEEVARVVQARASNPDWIAGMQRHGFRGAAEIAATLDHMASFAQLAGVVGTHLFDMFYEATLSDSHVSAFLYENNPAAFEAMKKKFEALHAAGLWISRRNSVIATFEGAT